MYPIYSLLRIRPGWAKKVKDELEQLAGVQEVTLVAGKYDIVVKVQGDMVIDALEVVVHEIRAIDGILDTETLVGVPLEAPAEGAKRKKSLLFNM